MIFSSKKCIDAFQVGSYKAKKELAVPFLGSATRTRELRLSQ